MRLFSKAYTHARLPPVVNIQDPNVIPFIDTQYLEYFQPPIELTNVATSQNIEEITKELSD